LHRLIFEDRDMRKYDNFGQQGCLSEELRKDRNRCEQSMTRTRQFVWTHWKTQKRGYVAVTRGSNENTFTTHLFIEPDDKGKWIIAECPIPLLREPEDPEHYRLGNLVEVKWAIADESETDLGISKGTRYLRLLNITGDFLAL